MRVGPGFYSPNHRMIEKRGDIAVMAYPRITLRNAREVQMTLALFGKEIFDLDYDPNYDLVKPNVPAFIYHQKTEFSLTNPPDSLIFNEQWKFYDSNYDSVKEKLPEVTFSKEKRKSIIPFLEIENLSLEAKLRFLLSQIPGVGTYNPEFKGVEREIRIPNFERFIGHNTNSIEKV